MESGVLIFGELLELEAAVIRHTQSRIESMEKDPGREMDHRRREGVEKDSERFVNPSGCQNDFPFTACFTKVVLHRFRLVLQPVRKRFDESDGIVARKSAARSIGRAPVDGPFQEFQLW